MADADKAPADETPEERAFDYARTVALSDGVFAIALTLLVLNITLPSLGADHHNALGSALADRREEFDLFAAQSYRVLAQFHAIMCTASQGLGRHAHSHLAPYVPQAHHGSCFG